MRLGSRGRDVKSGLGSTHDTIAIAGYALGKLIDHRNGELVVRQDRCVKLGSEPLRDTVVITGHTLTKLVVGTRRSM